MKHYMADLNAYVREHTQPATLDIEIAKRIILEQLAALPPFAEPVQSEGLLSHAERAIFQSPGPVPDGYVQSAPDLNQVKAQIAAREALIILQTMGVLISFGSPRPDDIGDMRVTFITQYGSTQSGGPVYFPSLYRRYRLASMHQRQNFRLAGGDVYLLYINHSRLPSRAARCLRECGDAFRHGLYLSATMTVGAASESLWMELGSLICKKNIPSSSKLAVEMNSPMPNIGRIIDPTWNALMTSHGTLLKGIFGHDGERDKFRDFAEKLRDRRNYAMHHKDANIDEPWFTYDATGLLLLYATTYFNQFADLLEAVNKLS
jgi:hypothetical protein